ncbi:mycothiol transferase [Knoellia remsis]|nr:DinB family protein [Knoellia remsis]
MSDIDMARSVLRDGFARTHDCVPEALDGLTTEDLLWRPDADANSIAWLVWHLARQQDEQVGQLAGRRSVWTEQGWAQRFNLPYAGDATGYGMSPSEVGDFRVEDPALLTEYHEAVHAMTVDYVDTVALDDLAEVIDENWDPPVTAATRLVSVIDDAAKHLGQAEYVGGLMERAR